ncbi:hypothetical protein CCP1ISM_10019 [Azospirillaceae bacterium]|nr:hypothetical protein MTCCP1_00020 [uncultured bacterium]
MDPAILVFTWFWLNHPPAIAQIEFPSMALCQTARQGLIRDRKRVLDEMAERSRKNTDDDLRSVPQLAALCVVTAAKKVAGDPGGGPGAGVDWLMGQPVNLLDWGLQKVANAADAVRAITVVHTHDEVRSEETLGVDFTLNDNGQFKYSIQGTVMLRSPGPVTDGYCRAALAAWRQAVLRSGGGNPSASLAEWFSHANRTHPAPPKPIAEALVASFEFKMTVNTAGAQSGISCTTAFAAEPAVKPDALPPR